MGPSFENIVFRICIVTAEAAWVRMEDGQNPLRNEYTRDGTTSPDADLRGLETFLTHGHGGIIRVEGENQYHGHSVTPRQYEPQHKQTTKNGVSLAAIWHLEIWHPETQNGTLEVAVSEVHVVYIRRIASSHRALPAVAIFTRTGTMPATLENIESVRRSEPTSSAAIGRAQRWARTILTYAMWMAGITPDGCSSSGIWFFLCTSLIVKRAVLLPLFPSTVIGWLFWNTSFVDPPLRTVKETMHDVKETTKDAAHTAKLMLQCVGGFLFSITAFFAAKSFLKLMHRIDQWGNLSEDKEGKGDIRH